MTLLLEEALLMSCVFMEVLFYINLYILQSIFEMNKNRMMRNVLICTSVHGSISKVLIK